MPSSGPTEAGHAGGGGAPSAAGVSFAFARRHGVLVTQLDADGAQVRYRPGVAIEAVTELRRHLDLPLKLQAVSVAEFDALLSEVYEQRADAAGLAGAVDDTLDLQAAVAGLGAPADLLEREDDAPVIRLINALLREAIREEASDLHFEPAEDALRVRLRVDGVLREVLSTAAGLAPLVISRIKVMAGLDIAEKRLPQDGRIALRMAGRALDLRVATIPAAFGERVVLRVLDKQAGRRELRQLGMDAATEARLRALIGRPHGIVLVTGPTGSGKTTTLYAALSHLNDHTRNIMTVEDPIEYYIRDIGQTPVNTRTGLSFAKGLRAILRQDPDVVMVGEIRDLETAQVAVQASLTGHLVFSTLHTNTAVGAVTRLRDIGVDGFLVAASLAGVLAQRLVRLLCPHCKAARAPSVQELELLGPCADEPLTLYEPAGCVHCASSGFRGRSGVYELLVVDEDARRLIHDGAGEQVLEQHFRRSTPSLFQSALARVRAGETSLGEVLRVVAADTVPAGG